MNFRRFGSLPIAAALGLLCASAVWAQGVQSQKAGQGMEQKKASPELMRPQQQLVIPGRCTTPDKVTATNLTLNPPHPKSGQAVVVSLTIQNLCDVPLAKIGWQIGSTPDNTILASGAWEASVAAGQTFTVTAPWTAAPGERGFDGRVDPANALRESLDGQRNNAKTVSINVPQVLETQVLSLPKAEAAGALRNSELVQGSGPPFVCERFGFSATRSSLEVLLSCVGVAILDVKAFRNFRLKNGWKIKSVARYPTNVNTKFFDEPIVGTNNPFIHVEITGAVGTLSYFVVIEGPPGTDPYN